MNTEDRIKGLIEANNLNVAKRRALALLVREMLKGGKFSEPAKAEINRTLEACTGQ